MAHNLLLVGREIGIVLLVERQVLVSDGCLRLAMCAHLDWTNTVRLGLLFSSQSDLVAAASRVTEPNHSLLQVKVSLGFSSTLGVSYVVARVVCVAEAVRASAVFNVLHLIDRWIEDGLGCTFGGRTVAVRSSDLSDTRELAGSRWRLTRRPTKSMQIDLL